MGDEAEEAAAADHVGLEAVKNIASKMEIGDLKTRPASGCSM